MWSRGSSISPRSRLGARIWSEADFDLRATIAGNHAILRMRAEVKGLTCTVEIDPRLPRVHGDRGRFGQVLLNLLANAIKFTERGGVALIARVAEEPSRRGGVALVVEVKDTGMGFPAAVSARDLRALHPGDRRPAP
ncbi:MAG: hypothetical protein IPK80_27355 [Nannocystis sp.]|nr:hypothetical protein [Nannocystis sp.]